MNEKNRIQNFGSHGGKMTLRHFFIGIIIAFIVSIIPALIERPFDQLEQQTTDLKMLVRGQSTIDTNIVILYLDNSDINALKRWPLPRNYYALLLMALHDVGVKVIGFDFSFSDPQPEYAENDSLLVRMTRTMENVVQSVYFDRLTSSTADTLVPQTIPARFVYKIPEPSAFRSGGRITLPFPALLNASAGIGHANLADEAVVRNFPLFIEYNGQLVPAISFELARLFLEGNRSSTVITGSSALIKYPGDTKRIPILGEGYVHLNYAGGTSSLHTVHFVDFLQAYGERNSHTPPPLISSLKGKIVLIGVIAEGRSSFVATPYSSKYPAVGVHATAIHNILHSNFLFIPALWIRLILSFIFGLFAFIMTIRFRELRGLLLTLGIFLAYCVLNIIFLIAFDLSLPLAIPGIVVLLVSFITMVYERRAMKETVTELAREKDEIVHELRLKESRVQELEKKLTLSSQQNTPAQGLIEELERQRRDLDELSSRAADLEAYQPEESPDDGAPEKFCDIIYSPSGRMAPLIQMVKKVATGDANVMISGESGTGKELIARAIHGISPRKEKPFIAVNCGALSESLLESELFGHERGAFTGAVKERTGRFELADGGTIFLDEIADTSEAFQVKLLRVVQEGEIERVGGTKTLKVDVRIIAATNKNLKQEIAAKRFREDLYYRLNVISLHLPPLHERKGDIPHLVAHFLAREKTAVEFSANAMSALMNYEWRGNIRELESIVKRAVILAQSEGRNLVRTKDLPPEIIAQFSDTRDLEEKIIISLREKKFSRSAISDTASELGGFNRGTIAEHFRGYCFKILNEQEWDIEKTSHTIAGTMDEQLTEKVQKKLDEYLSNIRSSIDKTKGIDENMQLLRPKYKNLPLRYHIYLDELIKALFDGHAK
jgi:transcriptional regulator with GAF, ATPase, and Fis domain/CHASE2 domain-containing sensor protein